MSEMVERVALAIQAADDDAKRNAEGQANGLSQDVSDWGAYLAKAAIKAMREPTEPMMTAMQESGVFDEVNGIIAFSAARGTHRGGLQGTPPMPAAYTIMIDAALGDEAAGPTERPAKPSGIKMK